ncbi:MAG: histidine phosphatase family protein [Pyrinomonadaceae bacterium]
MKTIYLMRHAKSSWSETDLADFDRPLNERGRKAAPFMGELMKSRNIDPQLILSSPAARARETALLVKASGQLAADIVFDDRIYEASPQGLRQVVSEQDDSVASVMIVGHNLGAEGFIRFLTGEVIRMPTASLAVVKADIDRWKEIAEGCGVIDAVYRPKDEMKAEAPATR